MRAWLVVLAGCGGGGNGTVAVSSADARALFPPAKACVQATAGNCQVTAPCPTTTAPAQASAGTIAVTGGGIPIELAFDATHAEYPETAIGDAVFFDAGATLTFSATGDEVPAFEGVLVAPSPSTVSSPRQQDLVPRDSDFNLAWHGGNFLVGATIRGPNVAIECSFSAAGGTGVIPASAMAMLQPGSAQIDFANANTSTIGAGGWDVTLLVNQPATSIGIVLE